ncbi:CDP-glycerol glycerophosphotransferase family protein [Cohnella sp. LGH]|uniref:CDP-glycerol glycerophosphotransferase family protein n=1 Tax=Cohnella sp. LGH TaxID=1619153 RepID=UPI001ADA7936|nr:CDP-glycerol glycerophosphotransferase family protein [Cohnella sp. LGH]QTH42273.1 CDP-glycerol glycerophosphotransferase family protein [Cohnella sp. LGH]
MRALRQGRKLQILELTQTLIEALQYLNTPEGSVADYLRSDCLDCIARISIELETLEVKRYVEYCDMSASAINNSDYVKALQQVDNLYRWIEAEVMAKYEVVFMPYKAEMWDALDSVWRAATADPMCDVRVVPIPYQSLGPGLAVIAEEYDGEKFPSYVDITHYADYDVSQSRPDAIFIHNPYDGYNTVTRVHPGYFSQVLAQYTGRLVYIPYFVSLGKINAGLTQFPSMKNVWKIIVESEFIRQEYLMQGTIPADKVVALGSPKLDYLINRMSELAPMPPEWEPVLKGRKVFLYNSTLNRLLNDDQCIRDMRNIFNYLTSRSDTSVIWRPHPLSLQTLKSMRPHMVNAYLTLVTEFKRMPNAVYDESQDMYTAIICSDAYVGDYSSVLIPYALSGKPILKMSPSADRKAAMDSRSRGEQLLSNFNSELYVPIAVAPGVIKENMLLFPALNRGHIYTLDLKTEELSALTGFSPDNYDLARCFIRSVAWKDDVWFVPGRSSSLIRYSRNTGKLIKHELPHAGGEQIGDGFVAAVEHESHLWVLPVHGNSLVQLNMETGEMVEESISDDAYEGADLRFSDGTIHAGQLWMSVYERATLLERDLASGDVRLHKLDFLQKPVRAIVSDGTALWLIPEANAAVIRWNPTTGEQTVYDKWPKGFKGGKKPFMEALFDGEWIWLVPQDANQIVRIHVPSGEVVAAHSGLVKSKWARLQAWYPFCYEGRNNDKDADDRLFSGAAIQGEWIWFYPVTATEMIGFHRSTGEVRKLNVNLDRADDEKTYIETCWLVPFEGQIDLRSTFYDYLLPLEVFTDMVVRGNNASWGEKQRKEINACLENADGTSGEKIWRFVADSLNITS